MNNCIKLPIPSSWPLLDCARAETCCMLKQKRSNSAFICIAFCLLSIARFMRIIHLFHVAIIYNLAHYDVLYTLIL